MEPKLIPKGEEGFSWLLSSPRLVPTKRWETMFYDVKGQWEFEVGLGAKVLRAAWDSERDEWSVFHLDGFPAPPTCEAWIKAMESF